MKEMGWGGKSVVVTRSKSWAQEKRLWWEISNISQLEGEDAFSFEITPCWPSYVVLLTHVLEQFLLSSSTKWMSGGKVESEFLKSAGVLVFLGIYCMSSRDKKSPSPYYVMSNTCPLVGRWRDSDRKDLPFSCFLFWGLTSYYLPSPCLFLSSEAPSLLLSQYVSISLLQEAPATPITKTWRGIRGRLSLLLHPTCCTALSQIPGVGETVKLQMSLLK